MKSNIIRKFKKEDIDELVSILKMNEQYDYPEIEGPEAMLRVAMCDAALFLVAENEEKAVGFIKAIYDGSRAFIHILSVHPAFQKSGIGMALVESAIKEFKKRGAPSISVTVSESSMGFWEKISFEKLPISLMLRSFD
ncbi:MAG: GNAT family N-acetyltransferase [Promethearchaeota archaeon]